MPKATTKKSNTRKSSAQKDVLVASSVTSPTRGELVERVKGFKNNRRFWLVVIILGLLLLAYYKKNWFVAAMVNNQPISTFELNNKLNKLYKERVLNQMINEKVLEQEASKKGLQVSQDEINAKIAEQENQFGGKENFDSLLSQQGLTRDELANQTRLQLLVEKLYANESSPSAEEVEKYMTDNSTSPEATEPAKFRQTAEEAVRQDKLSKVFSEQFQKLRQDAKVNIF
jgi:hypothetical protein